MVKHGPIVLILLILLSGCIPRSGQRPNSTMPNSAMMKQCVGDLTQLKARFTVLPDQNYGGGCSAINAVLVQSFSVPVTNTKAVQCPVARALTLWVRGPVQASALAVFGSRVTRIESMGTYACRKIIGGNSGQLSEHARANAIDISAFILANGRRVTVETGWQGDADERRFLRDIRDKACRQFQTVLSPDYNAAHYNHLHFDMGRGPYCR
jgi:hypothetical protein